MKNKIFKQFIFNISLFFMCISFNAQAEHKALIMGRSLEAFPEAMSVLQSEIKKAGYTISIVQRVDIGLTGMGFQTDKYRVVFFGKPEEIKTLPKKYPELTPYLPLAITIFAEQDETILTAMSPHFIEHAYESDSHEGQENNTLKNNALKNNALKNKELNEIFQRWEKDIESIIEKVSQHE